jgi:hypothetical protein
MFHFKVGDRVRLNQDYGGIGPNYMHKEGTEGVVTRCGGLGVALITVEGEGFLNGKCKAYEHRFDLVEEYKAPEPEKTDKELGDEFRANLTRNREIEGILVGRGYTRYVGTAKMTRASHDISTVTFKKTVTEEFVV